jgi:protein-S-isoprenylcysteine O-methyltransferase Ste14
MGMSVFAVTIIILAMLFFNVILLFVTSGDLHWRGAWLYLLFFTVVIFITSGLLFQNGSGLVEERWGKNDNVKSWDKLLMPITAIITPQITIVIAGLEVRLYGLKCTSLNWQLCGLGLGGICCFILAWSMLTNNFFSTHVRIQGDRHHQVVSKGPYRLVRHPGYVAMLFYAMAMPLILGSCWSVWPAIAMACFLIIRTALEDKTLIAELPGYKEYTTSVRFRLIPGIW